jgi:hypothetical protein
MILLQLVHMAQTRLELLAYAAQAGKQPFGMLVRRILSGFAKLAETVR